MPVSHHSEKGPDVFRQLELYREAESPDIYAMHDFIESVIGGSSTKSNFHGTLRVITDEGRLPEFAAVVEKFNKKISDVQDADDRFMFGHLVTEARNAIRTLASIVITPPKPDIELVHYQIARNQLDAAGLIYQSTQNRQSA